MKETTETIKGTIEKYNANKHDDIDGFTINENGKLKEIKFPPHTAKYIMALAEKSDDIEITIENEENKGDKPHPPKKKLVKITNAKTNKSFETKSIHPPKPTAGQDTIELNIEKYKLQKGKKEEVIGIVFKDNLIHIHPKGAEKITDVLEKNLPLKVTAKKRVADAGFVNQNHLHVYHAEAIEVNGVEHQLKH